MNKKDREPADYPIGILHQATIDHNLQMMESKQREIRFTPRQLIQMLNDPDSDFYITAILRGLASTNSKLTAFVPRSPKC